jgi:hypothetical protein
MQGKEAAHNTNGKVNKSLALAYALQGRTYTDIAKEFGVTQSAISQAIAEHRDDIEACKSFSKHKDTFLEFEAWKLLNLANDETRKKALMSRGYTDYGILHDKVQTLRGQNTGNEINVNVILGLKQTLSALKGTQDVVVQAIDNDSPNPNMLISLDKTNNEQSDKKSYVNLSDSKAEPVQRAARRKGRPRKG